MLHTKSIDVLSLLFVLHSHGKQVKYAWKTYNAASCIRNVFMAHKQKMLQNEIRMQMYKQKALRTIQSCARMYISRKKLNAKHSCASIIQRTVRMFFARNYFTKNREGATKIQSVYRMYRRLCIFRKIQGSTCKIQSIFRRYMAEKDAVK